MNFPQNSSCIPKQLGYYADMKRNKTCKLYYCTGKNTRTLSVAAGSDTDARRIYRSFFPKNRIKDIVAEWVGEPPTAQELIALKNAGCGV